MGELLRDLEGIQLTAVLLGPILFTLLTILAYLAGGHPCKLFRPSHGPFDIIDRCFGTHPFQVWIAPRWAGPRKLWRQALGRKTDGSGRNYPPSRLSRESVLFRGDSEYRLFLYPARLRAWFYSFAIMIGIAFSPLCWQFAFAIPIGYSLGYWVLYRIVRRPVIEKAWNEWPRPLEAWVPSLVQRIDLSKKDTVTLKSPGNGADLLLSRACRKRSRFTRSALYRPRPFRLPVNLSPESSRQAIFLQLCMLDLFRGNKATKEDGHKLANIDVGLVRLYIYWYAPIWIGYLLLLSPILLSFFSPNEFIRKEDLGRLTLPLIAWATLSLLLILNQSRYLSKPVGKTEKHQEYTFPPRIYDKLPKYGTLEQHYANLSFTKVTGVIYTAAVSIYLVLIQTAAKIADPF